MKKLKNIFISSTHQNAGKTTVSLGLYKAFCEKKLRTAFLKPVGQQTVTVGQMNVDKDSYLIGEVYRCQRKMKDMSPITVGPGYTKEYIYQPEKDKLHARIVNSFSKLTKGKDAIIVEGTGHAGVGAVIDLSNAEVARILNSKVVIVSEGGIGRCIDGIMLNKALFDQLGVEVLGVIINKVLSEKYKKVRTVLEQGFRNKGIRLLGVIPLDPLLIQPTVGQVMNQCGLSLLCGQSSLSRRVKNTIVAAMEPYNMINYLSDGALVVTSGDRVDNIMVAMSSHLVMSAKRSKVSGIILTGGLMPNQKIIDLLKRSRIPVLMSPDDTYTVAGKIEHLICKIQKTDRDKILEARHLIKKYVDVDRMLESL